eukprot:1140112-Prymnesium_polylepis.1
MQRARLTIVRERDTSAASRAPRAGVGTVDEILLVAAPAFRNIGRRDGGTPSSADANRQWAAASERARCTHGLFDGPGTVEQGSIPIDPGIAEHHIARSHAITCAMATCGDRKNDLVVEPQCGVSRFIVDGAPESVRVVAVRALQPAPVLNCSLHLVQVLAPDLNLSLFPNQFRRRDGLVGEWLGQGLLRQQGAVIALFHPAPLGFTWVDAILDVLAAGQEGRERHLAHINGVELQRLPEELLGSDVDEPSDVEPVDNIGIEKGAEAPEDDRGRLTAHHNVAIVGTAA